jgi:hypothetical protein
MSFTKSFIGGAVGGAAYGVASNVGFGRIWNWLCVIFLPIWLIVFSIGAVGIMASGSNAAGFAVWGWTCMVLSVLFTIFLTNAAAKITAPYQLTSFGVIGFWINTIRYGSWGKKIFFLLPAIFLVFVALGFAVFASVLSIGTAIGVGVYVGVYVKKENAIAEQLAVRLGTALGGELLPGSLFYGNEPGTFGIHPLPPAAIALVSDVNELRPRIDSFAPEWEVRYLDTETLIVGPRTYATQTEPETPLAAAE